MEDDLFSSWFFKKLENYEYKDLIAAENLPDEFINKFSNLYEYLKSFPSEAKFFEFRAITPSTMASVFGDPFIGLVCAAESTSMAWVYSNIFKLRAYFEGFETMLRSGNLLVAASCARGIFEQVSSFNYSFSRISYNKNKGDQLLNMQRKNIKKGKKPPHSWQGKLFEVLVQHIQMCLKSIQGSDFDWSKFLIAEIAEQHKDILSDIIDDSSKTKKLHINDAIKGLPGKQSRNFELYSALCDFVHPNIGSHWMIMDVRDSKTSEVFDTTLTDKPVNHDAVVFFIMVVSTALLPLLKLAEEQIKEGIDIAKEYKERAIEIQKSATIEQ